MNQAIVNRIRPMSWKICVQGKNQAEYVRSKLSELQMEATACEQERDLADPPVYSFIVVPAVDSCADIG